MNITGPPYDGKPCPMCPQEVRNLSAIVHNLAWRLEDYHGGCFSKIIEKFQCMKEAVASVTRDNTWPTELLFLYDVATVAARCETLESLLKCKTSLVSASNGVRPLSDAHFADRKHSHGEVPHIGKPIDELKFKDGSTYGDRKSSFPSRLEES